MRIYPSKWGKKRGKSQVLRQNVRPPGSMERQKSASMRRGQVEQTDCRAHSATPSPPLKASVSWCQGTHILLAFFFLSLSVLSRGSYAGDVTLGWNANTESELAGYKLYYGTASRQYTTSIDVGKVITYTLSGLPTGTYYFALTAYSARVNQNEISPPPRVRCLARRLTNSPSNCRRQLRVCWDALPAGLRITSRSP